MVQVSQIHILAHLEGRAGVVALPVLEPQTKVLVGEVVVAALQNMVEVEVAAPVMAVAMELARPGGLVALEFHQALQVLP